MSLFSLIKIPYKPDLNDTFLLYYQKIQLEDTCCIHFYYSVCMRLYTIVYAVCYWLAIKYFWRKLQGREIFFNQKWCKEMQQFNCKNIQLICIPEWFCWKYHCMVCIRVPLCIYLMVDGYWNHGQCWHQFLWIAKCQLEFWDSCSSV